MGQSGQNAQCGEFPAANSRWRLALLLVTFVNFVAASVSRMPASSNDGAPQEAASEIRSANSEGPLGGAVGAGEPEPVNGHRYQLLFLMDPRDERVFHDLNLVAQAPLAKADQVRLGLLDETDTAFIARAFSEAQPFNVVADNHPPLLPDGGQRLRPLLSGQRPASYQPRATPWVHRPVLLLQANGLPHQVGPWNWTKGMSGMDGINPLGCVTGCG